MVNTRRRYVTIEEVEAYADVDIKSNTDALQEAYNQISQAEQMIDDYVGTQIKHVTAEYDGVATGGSETTLIDTSSSSLSYTDGYFNYCEVEILSGTNQGEVRQISESSMSEKKITVTEAFSNPIDDTSVYVIRQFGKFPRSSDVRSIDSTFYKNIPPEVKEAVKAQVQYMLEMGKEFFVNIVDKNSEDMDGYSYQNKNVVNIIAPKARSALKRIVNRKGKLIV